ncbi:hypothetical protein D3C87_1627480 [compost metagenome]
MRVFLVSKRNQVFASAFGYHLSIILVVEAVDHHPVVTGNGARFIGDLLAEVQQATGFFHDRHEIPSLRVEVR